MSGGEEFLKGHRRRLRTRLREGGVAALSEYEILEIILFRAFPRGDVKPLAKTLLKRFGSLAEVIAAEPHSLAEVEGIGDRAVEEIALIRAALSAFAKSRTKDRPLLASWDRLIDYCNVAMGYESVENFRVLFLDQKNRLIEDKLVQTGTVDRASVYPREIVKWALRLESKSVILVHNHPSGDPTPSRSDIDLTEKVARSLRTVDIRLHDHLVIARGRYVSLRALDVIEEMREKR